LGFGTIRIAINTVMTQQFILLLSTVCFGLKGHHQIEYENKSFKKFSIIVLFQLGSHKHCFPQGSILHPLISSLNKRSIKYINDKSKPD